MSAPIVYLGRDVHKDTLAPAVSGSGGDPARVGLTEDEERELLGRGD